MMIKRTIGIAALAISSLFAPLAANAATPHEFRSERPAMRPAVVVEAPAPMRPVFVRPVIARPVIARPIIERPMVARPVIVVRHVEHARRDGWRVERGHEIRSGRVVFEHGRR